MLELQRTAGNAAVSALLEDANRVRIQRDTKWPDAPAKDAKLGTQGINAGPSSSGSVRRYPVSGLSVGNADPKPDDAAWEAADRRAIVLIPDGLEPGAGKVDVLFLLHGHSVGWREGRLGEGGPVTKKNPLGSSNDPIGSEYSYGYALKGETRDRLPDDIGASLNPNMVAVLPQGTNAPDFGSYETEPYVRAALTMVAPAWEKVALGRIVLSAHSGGGPNISAPLVGRKPHDDRKVKPKDVDVTISPGIRDIALFDAINGSGEEGMVEKWLTGQIAADIAELKSTPDDEAAQEKYLSTSLQFVAYFSDTEKDDKTKNPGFYVPQHLDLRAFIERQFKKGPASVTAAAWGSLHQHYQVIGPQHRRHDHMIRDNVRPALDLLGLKMPTPAATPALHRIVDDGPPVQRSQTEDLDKGFKAGGKGEVFDLLRQWGSSGPITPEKGLPACLDRLFGPDGSSASETDDRWLADQIIASGSEPHWNADAFKERAKRTHDHKWAAEAGNIEGSFDAGKGKTSLEAFFFPGTSDKRAMIIGGVHGSEASGVEVVNDLLADMRKPDAAPPYYSVIVVPVIFPENLKAGSRTTTKTSEDPNRNFPKAGVSLAQATGKKGPRDSQDRAIEPENVILIDLIERFQPERIASVHGHTPPPAKPDVGQDMPGIFDDPRAGADEKKADDALALEMAKAADKKGVRVPGNWLGTKNETSEYPPGAPKTSKGVSLGDYGPKPTDARPAATVVTVEVFGYATSEKSKDGAARKKELESLATVLRDIFLAPPASPATAVSPATSASPAKQQP
jgi:Succinylglutamate desuccinylase / Aspartoacylase family